MGDGSDDGEVYTKEFGKLVDIVFSNKNGEKINTTHDRSYDYKLSNGKYYFKGKGGLSNRFPDWVEAKGKGLDAIKTKVKFN
jgi:hypothetical protein